MIWLVVAFCWAISFLFAGIEAGLLALDPVRLRHRADSGDRGACRLQKMVKQPERLLITVLIATNAADIIALIIVTHELVLRFGWLGYLAAVAIALPVYLFLLGVLPTAVLFIVGVLTLGYRKKLIMNAAIAVLATLGVWLLFSVLLRLQLYTGLDFGGVL